MQSLSTLFRSRYNLGLEILVLRQQQGILQREHPRPRLRITERQSFDDRQEALTSYASEARFTGPGFPGRSRTTLCPDSF
jgi:hypothetical protein